MRALTGAQRQELDALRGRKKLLLAEHVVAFAEDENTALHSRFEWDDTEAAQQYRLWQARTVIRVSVVVLKSNTAPVRAYVSMLDDRAQEGGGYRLMADVMNNPNLREKLLQEALAELQRFQAKYDALVELAPVFEAAEKVAAQSKGGRRRKSVA